MGFNLDKVVYCVIYTTYGKERADSKPRYLLPMICNIDNINMLLVHKQLN